jgi:hypothetical protein
LPSRVTSSRGGGCSCRPTRSRCHRQRCRAARAATTTCRPSSPGPALRSLPGRELEHRRRCLAAVPIGASAPRPAPLGERLRRCVTGRAASHQRTRR